MLLPNIEQWLKVVLPHSVPHFKPKVYEIQGAQFEFLHIVLCLMRFLYMYLSIHIWDGNYTVMALGATLHPQWVFEWMTCKLQLLQHYYYNYSTTL